MIIGKRITIYRSGFLNACGSIQTLMAKYDIVSAVNNDGDWTIIIQRK